MIWSIDLSFEAPDHDDALKARNDIEALMASLTWLQPIHVSEVAEKRPLVRYEEKPEP